MTRTESDPYLQLLEWDSAFFGKSIARARTAGITDNSLPPLLSASVDTGVDCLYLLLDADANLPIQLVERNGFHLVDIRVTLDRTLQAEIAPWNPLSPIIRLAKPSDISQLRMMASANHRDSRFYSDGNFPTHLCDELYAIWIEKSCQGDANAVLVADRNGKPAGYTSCHITENGNGQIGLVGVSSKCQGEGLGRKLIEESLRWFAANGCERVEVVTQGKNIGAQRLYQKCGFFSSRIQLWYHKWFEQTT